VYITNLIWVIKRPTAEEDAGDQTVLNLDQQRLRRECNWFLYLAMDGIGSKQFVTLLRTLK